MSGCPGSSTGPAGWSTGGPFDAAGIGPFATAGAKLPVELADRERELGREPRAARALPTLTGEGEWRSTFAFRVGLALRDAVPSPRRPVDAVLF